LSVPGGAGGAGAPPRDCFGGEFVIGCMYSFLVNHHQQSSLIHAINLHAF